MNKHRLLYELDKVAARYRLLRFWQLLAVAWLVAAAVGLGLWGMKYALAHPLQAAVPALALVAIVMLLGGAWLATYAARDVRWVARQIEAAFPELRTSLLAAVELQPDLPDGRYGFLQSNVIHQALQHADRHEWRQVVSTGRIATAAVAQVAALGLFLAVVGGIALTTVKPSTAAALLASLRPSANGMAFTMTVEPGNTEVERGTSLLVLARIVGAMPAEATLVIRPAQGEETRLAMAASLDDPMFGARIPIVDQALDYSVEAGEQRTPTFHVEVFEYPRMEKADARLVYPSYTGMEERVVQDVRTISVVEGTSMTLTCNLNKLVQTARLIEDKSAFIELELVGNDRPAYTTTLLCNETRRLKVELVDHEGRKNVKTAQITINVVPNQPVQLKPVFPARDVEVSALEELEVKATAYDDYGIQRFGLSYGLSGKEAVEVQLGEKIAARQKQDLAYVLRLEEMQAQPDDLLSYHFWAEDFAPDGSVRRVESDMYFAEVRPFEEIFRQGEAQPGGQPQQQQQQQSPAGMQAQQLAQLQKEIINATWKVIRREVGGKLTPPFGSDVEQIQLSQASAVEQATALVEKLQDPESQEHGEAVIQAMQAALAQLTTAHDQPSREPLMPALKAEQAAYQALLKLRAREHSIVRQNQRQRGAAGGQRSQQQRQQMQQLELKDDENRYETERQAQEQQETPEERENRQVLSRLRELAQRQHDLNERLKELQSALEEARTTEQKEELKRQLQRLQDEQRQVLQDTEELQSRMESPENAERMSTEREQLQETRDQVQRASEALDEQRVSQAAAAGTRAEQNFEELRNEFRRRASGRFSEEMQQMREAARELDQKEQELSQRLKEAAQPAEQSANKSLRDTGEREKLAEELSQQRQRLGGLTEQMRQTIENAETTEPLLAERLYDAARKAQDTNVERALEIAERALRSGLAREAQQLEQPAGQAISELREGIDRAAEAVLGDETEALRRAREELQGLANELSNEIRRNDPQREPGVQPGEGDSSEAQQSREGQPGERQEADGQKGAGSPGKKGGKGKSGKGEKGEAGKGEPGQEQNADPDGISDENQAGEPGEGKKGASKGGKSGQGQPGESESEQGKSGKGKAGQGKSGKGGQGKGGSPGEGSEGGEAQPGQREGGQRQAGQRPRGLRDGNDDRRGGGFDPQERVGPGGGNERMFAPLTGEGFREWSDRLRDVEEMVVDPELRAEAARIRERARSLRAEFKRHSQEPNWGLVEIQLATPLNELRDRVAAELLRRTAKQAIVPLDRDPVPPKYAEKTRLYYERLSSGSRQEESP